MIKRIAMILAAAGIISASLCAQETDGLRRGFELYESGRWRDAIIVLRQASAEASPLASAEATYWIALAELASGDYQSALRDLDELSKTSLAIHQASEIPYQKGRALYHLGRFDEAILLMKTYSDSSDDDQRKASAAYWIGEALFSLGRFDESRSVFTAVMERYPTSAKYEASFYRVALIDQKARETELLKLLKWSHEESLKTVEEYQRRERSYEQAIVAYQKRIAEMLKDTRLADLEDQAKSQNDRIAALEASLAQAKESEALAEARIIELSGLVESGKLQTVSAPAVAAPPPRDASERLARLLAIKADALELKDSISKDISSETAGAEK